IAITACTDGCATPEINCIALVGAVRDGEEGFGVLVGGGLSSVPRIGRELGTWVPTDDALAVLVAIPVEWTEALRDRVEPVTARLAEIGLPLDAGPLRGDAIACTGEPHCNFSVTETKSRMDGLVQLLESRFGPSIHGLRLHLDGCPHACAQHWVGDIGFQGTTARDDEGRRRQAYDVFLRGRALEADIADPVLRAGDRKSTRLNSSHVAISYAVFCLKK